MAYAHIQSARKMHYQGCPNIRAALLILSVQYFHQRICKPPVCLHGLTLQSVPIKLRKPMNYQEQGRRRDFDNQRFEQLVSSGIAAVKGGDFDQARQLLEKAAAMMPTDARPWLWMSATTEDLEQRRHYLENALAADPNNSAARRGLVLLSDQTERDKVLQEGEGVTARHPQEPEEAQSSETFLCTNCGGRMRFDLDLQDMRCEHCGQVRTTEETTIDGTAERPLDYVLPTSRGHMWAEAQHQLACERCGGISLLPPGETVHECPFCGSQSLFEASERQELIDPQALGLMRVNREAARIALRDWLGGGLFIPDDLTRMVKTAALRPAYYPFWTISGTLELQWKCEVNLGGGNADRWVLQSGYEFENFDDELVPGLKSMSQQELAAILPFNLDDVVEFRPEYLAGWTAMTYDRPLADASLTARERVVRRVRRELPSRVEIGREKRNLSTGATNWSGMTYKYLLLPLWIGTYNYRGQDFRIFVNGQTGKVAGKKPVDRVKVGATAAGGFLMLLALMLILLFIAFSLGWLPT